MSGRCGDSLSMICGAICIIDVSTVRILTIVCLGIGMDGLEYALTDIGFAGVLTLVIA